MRAIGIRVTPSEIYYCVTEKNESEVIILSHDSIIVPQALDIPWQLAFIRTNLISLFNEYNIVLAGIRIHEGSTQNLSIKRIYFEGVIQEMLANCNVHKFFVGTLKRIGSLIEESVPNIKEFIDGNNSLIELADIPKSAKEVRESILTSVAACELAEGGVSDDK